MSTESISLNVGPIRTVSEEELNTPLENGDSKLYGRSVMDLNPLKKFAGFGQYTSIAKSLEHIGVILLRTIGIGFTAGLIGSAIGAAAMGGAPGIVAGALLTVQPASFVANIINLPDSLSAGTFLAKKTADFFRANF